jgi:hypothetical protein
MHTDDAAFHEVFQDEMTKWVAPRRNREAPPADVPAGDGGYLPKVDNALIGLALSGGGVRAATYSLGAIQRLSQLGVLPYVDYLSTASGGGYLGTSWSSLTAGDSPYGSKKESFPFKFIGTSDDAQHQVYDRESDAVRHVRAHGNWLAPHLGLFDVRSWVMLFHYLSSTIINLALIPTPWVLGIIGLSIMLPAGFWDRAEPWGSDIFTPMVAGPLAFFALFMLFVWWRPKDVTRGADFKHRFYPLQKSVLIVAVSWTLADLFILGIAGSYWLQGQYAGWMASLAGVSGATLLGTAGSAYQFFSKGAEGGVPAKDSGFKKLLGALVGILGFVALAVLLLAVYYALDVAFFPGLPGTRGIPQELVLMTLAAFGVAGFMLAIPAHWFLNFFSLQALYRSGLRKAYVLRRASKEEQDRQEGKEVIPRGNERFLLSGLMGENGPPDMPYQLIVTALNTSGDTQLERLGRRSDGMLLASLRSGSRVTGYAPTATSAAFKDITLGDAMAASGAAASPNMGRNTNTSLAILLTLFNVRIGTWIPNPNEIKRTRISNRFLVWYWLKELFGIASADDNLVYLTDGGHFDNSAIYELLKRRCKYIIAIDASKDIGNLATVARLARIDFGVQMDVDMAPFMPDDTGRSTQPYVVAKLKYPQVTGDTDAVGYLLWVSTARTEGQKPDVIRYGEMNTDFPFDSTGDQLFDQSQFESYRQLGHTAVRAALSRDLVGEGPLTRNGVGEKLEALWEEAGKPEGQAPGG